MRDVGDDEINWQDPDIIHVINYRGHFMPLIRKAVPKLSDVDASQLTHSSGLAVGR